MAHVNVESKWVGGHGPGAGVSPVHPVANARVALPASVRLQVASLLLLVPTLLGFRDRYMAGSKAGTGRVLRLLI